MTNFMPINLKTYTKWANSGGGALTSKELERFNNSSLPTEVIGIVVQNLPTKITPD